ncbi:MAG: formylglycine-generating enzyme family protein, partial [Planctomycetota bacterium]|nr:formylglycine-generating enzyme family protein [Planctomycetota bacterium]
PPPTNAPERRMVLRRQYGGPPWDPEAVPNLPRPTFTHTDPQAEVHHPEPKATTVAAPPAPAGWPFDADEARRRQADAGPRREVTVDLAGGVMLRLVRIPAGEFLMGRDRGAPDEQPRTRVRIERPFWMGACEVTNAQFRRFDSDFDPRYYTKRHARQDDKGLPLDGPDQPAVRVSWNRALGFCRWLSERTGRRFTLPTEAQWEWACRAGSDATFAFGAKDADYSRHANLGDQSFSRGLLKGGKQVTGGVEHLVIEGADLADRRFNDKAVVTCAVGRYEPNAWGLHDMHGNAAEWTRTAYRPSVWRAGDGRDDPAAEGEKVVRGGSFFDPPKRCRSTFRIRYAPWQRVFNVGFRVVCEADRLPKHLAVAASEPRP